MVSCLAIVATIALCAQATTGATISASDITAVTTTPYQSETVSETSAFFSSNSRADAFESSGSTKLLATTPATKQTTHSTATIKQKPTTDAKKISSVSTSVTCASSSSCPACKCNSNVPLYAAIAVCVILLLLLLVSLFFIYKLRQQVSHLLSIHIGSIRSESTYTDLKPSPQEPPPQTTNTYTSLEYKLKKKKNKIPERKDHKPLPLEPLEDAVVPEFDKIMTKNKSGDTSQTSTETSLHDKAEPRSPKGESNYANQGHNSIPVTEPRGPLTHVTESDVTYSNTNASNGLVTSVEEGELYEDLSDGESTKKSVEVQTIPKAPPRRDLMAKNKVMKPKPTD